MAKVIENEKGFKVIEISLSECANKLGGLGICDSCNNAAFNHKYIAVLNSCYCNKCYEDFETNATYYPEDSKFENINFEATKSKLGIK